MVGCRAFAVASLAGLFLIGCAWEADEEDSEESAEESDALNVAALTNVPQCSGFCVGSANLAQGAASRTAKDKRQILANFKTFLAKSNLSIVSIQESTCKAQGANRCPAEKLSLPTGWATVPACNTANDVVVYKTASFTSVTADNGLRPRNPNMHMCGLALQRAGAKDLFFIAGGLDKSGGTAPATALADWATRARGNRPAVIALDMNGVAKGEDTGGSATENPGRYGAMKDAGFEPSGHRGTQSRSSNVTFDYVWRRYAKYVAGSSKTVEAGSDHKWILTSITY